MKKKIILFVGIILIIAVIVSSMIDSPKIDETWGTFFKIIGGITLFLWIVDLIKNYLRKASTSNYFISLIFILFAIELLSGTYSSHLYNCFVITLFSILGWINQFFFTNSKK